MEKINQRGGGNNYSSFDIAFKDDYIIKHRLVNIGLNEKLLSGTIEIINNSVNLND